VVSPNNRAYAFVLKYCVITSIGVTMQAQDMMINEQLQLLFCSMNMRALGVPTTQAIL
jgi:hypothetical protein